LREGRTCNDGRRVCDIRRKESG